MVECVTNRSRLLAAAAMAASLLALASCASAPTSGDAFAFGVMGDTPYNEREEPHFLEMIERMNAEPLAFVIHVGDFKAGSHAPCTDELFARRKAQFDLSAHPLIYTPGDNEWTDCRRPTNGAMDPVERLAKLREVFFSGASSLGRERMDTTFQAKCAERDGGACPCPAQPENRAWMRSGVRFVTVNFPGPDDDVGHGAATDAEARCRDAANRQWLERAVRESAGADTRGLVVATQADPWVNKVFQPFLRELAAAAQRLGKPVLFVHGDTHIYRFDTPFVDESGQALANPSRLETYGSPFVGWEKVTVDPGYPDLFRVESKLQALVPPR